MARDDRVSDQELVAPSPALAPLGLRGLLIPRLIKTAGDDADRRYIEFFIARYRNEHTRRAYRRHCEDFFAWCDRVGLRKLSDIHPVHVATYIEGLTRELAAGSVKQARAGLSQLFAWMMTGGYGVINPVAPVKGPREQPERAATPSLDTAELRVLFDSIPLARADKRGESHPDLLGHRDLCLIALMTFTLARISAALAVTVKDLTWRRHELSVRLEEKRGKVLDRPCHHLLTGYLARYLELTRFDGDHPLFPSFQVSKQAFSDHPLRDDNARVMIARRCKAAGITKNITPHSFRGSGITALLEADVALDQVRDMAGHSSTKITEIYDGRPAKVSRAAVEKIQIY